MKNQVKPQKLCQIEILATDLGSSSQFYAEVFGWPLVPADIDGVIVLDVPRDCGFGISLISHPHPEANRSVLLYFEVSEEDHKSILKSTTDSNGHIVKETIKRPGYGNVSIIQDPDAHRWGIFTRISNANLPV